jgi:hypothetical protein
MKISLKSVLVLACAAAAALTLQSAAAASTPIENNNQYKAQISFFKDALDEFGPSDPDQAVRLWAKGDRMRNGVFKYAVSDDALKQKLTDRWGAPDKNFWIIGGSSPWLTSYEITGKTKVSPSELRYTVKYSWTTSAGPETPTVEELTVVRDKDVWRIHKVVPLSGFQNY